jgi:hypothetical protein
MKTYDVAMPIVLIIVAIAAAAGYLSSKKWGHDNPAEEACEEIIEDQIGIDVDLTPGSPESTGHSQR